MSPAWEPQPQLVVVVNPAAGLRARPSTPSAPASVDADDADAGALQRTLERFGGEMAPQHGKSEVKLRGEAQLMQSLVGVTPPDLARYYTVAAPPEQLSDLAYELLDHDAVDGAYAKPAPALPQLNTMVPKPEPAPPATPDFTSDQRYLDAAPEGIDARFAWATPGGLGAGVKVVDVEGSWLFSHEDLSQNQGGVIGGVAIDDLGWRNHGTAVIAAFSGDSNGIGVTGICPEANVRASSIFIDAQGNNDTARAIKLAADALDVGDILLVELHRGGPQFEFENRDDQLGFIAVEWWPDDFDAILYATRKGVIVVEAAGNGAENLDDGIYDQPGPGFPPDWANPFKRDRRDSGAIIVGAGAPPPGTHGRDHGADRSRLDFSDHGLAVDVQGWGREVTTCGYGDRQGGVETEFYTDTFSGTSSASPVVVGALGCMQGAVRAAALPPVAPWRARQLLRATGSPQQDGPSGPASERIGRRPDLAALIPRATTLAPVTIQRLADEQWSLGWTLMAAFQLDGQPHVLVYKGADYQENGQPQLGGGTTVDRVNDDGASSTNVMGTTWSKGWTHMLTVPLPSGVHLVSYKRGVSGSANAAIDRIESGGANVTGVRQEEWGAGWTNFATFALDGRQHLFSFSRPEGGQHGGMGGGGVSVDRFLDDGTGFENVTGETFGTPWTHFSSFEAGGSPQLLSYRQDLGRATIDTLDASGGFTPRWRDGTWSNQWTHFASLNLGGEPYQVAYQSATGVLDVDRLLPEADGVETMLTTDIGAGWTLLSAFELDAVPHLLTYNASDGSAAYWALG